MFDIGLHIFFAKAKDEGRFFSLVLSLYEGERVSDWRMRVDRSILLPVSDESRKEQ